MKTYLQKAVFVNRAPFEKMELDFDENEIAVLSAINGRGKTTILSHIVDSFYEMAKPYFSNEFENREHKLYRVSSPIDNLDQTLPSFVYLRFKIKDEYVDYIDIRNLCTKEQYDNAIKVENKIPFSQFEEKLKGDKRVKEVSANFNKEKANQIFTSNVLTYFPSYRYEQPGYLNDPYKIKLDFKKLLSYTGYLTNPIEVVTGLPQLANWIMDIVLDIREYRRDSGGVLLGNLNLIITNALISKGFNNPRIGIGPRNLGGTRIRIMETTDEKTEKTIYPTIFNLSSGESSILCLFGELLRQADNNKNSIPLLEITGVILVDEVDKHLHIKLQKEVLPKLFKLFPNVQFIVSSHSPFLSMGLAEDVPERSKIVDLDNLGISTGPTTNDLYKEVYDMMISENDRFKERFQSLEQEIKRGTKPLIVTEGKTDIQHIKKAKNKLEIKDLDLDFCEIPVNWGSAELKKYLGLLSKFKQNRKIIGIFDRDEDDILADIEKGSQPYKTYGNNVFAFCLPVPDLRKQYTNISIEFYYSDAELKKEKEGKRLFFDCEINELYNKSTHETELRLLRQIDTRKENTKKVYSGSIGSCNWILTKSDFAGLVETDPAFIKNFNFNNFKLIFEKIKQIVSTN